MFKKVKRKAENSKSWRCFVNRVRYLIDQMHPHHKIKKVVQAAINFGCLWGQTAKDFIQAVHESQQLWEIRNKNGKGGGNPTEDIFFELIYSAPKGLRTTLEERNTIDRMITEPFRDCPIRRNWHLAAWELEETERPENWKDIDDSHYLFSARDVFGNATISSRFGNGRETLESWMRRMDEEICDMLNKTREKQYEPVRPIYIRKLEKKVKVKLTKLHEMVAHHTSEPITRDNLVEVIEKMERPSIDEPGKMVPVAKVANLDRSLEHDKLVWVLFHGREKPRKYRIEKLLLNIADTQLDIELARPDGNDGEEGGAGGESGGGTGGLGGVEIDTAQSDSPAPTPAPSGPPETDSMASRPDPLPSVLKSASAPLGVATPVKHDPALSTPKSAAVKPGPTPAAPGLIPAFPGSMLPSSAESVPATDEPAKPKDTSLPPAHAAGSMQHPEPMHTSPSRGKSRWRPKHQPKQEDEEQKM